MEYIDNYSTETALYTCYLIEIKSKKEHFLKFGYSSNVISRINSFSTNGYFTRLIYVIHQSEDECLSIEKAFANSFKQYIPIQELSSGNTECFEISEKTPMKNMMEKIGHNIQASISCTDWSKPAKYKDTKLKIVIPKKDTAIYKFLTEYGYSDYSAIQKEIKKNSDLYQVNEKLYKISLVKEKILAKELSNW